MTAESEPRASGADGRDTAPVFALLTVFVNRWRLVIGLPVLGAVVGVIVALILPNAYTARTTFIPAVGTGPTIGPALSGLASQFGIPIGTGTSLSPDFFGEVLGSRELLRATLQSSFNDPTHPGSTRPLLDILPLQDKTSGDRVEDGIRYLDQRISRRVDRRTGVITLTFVGASPVLAADVANRMVELLNKFNLERLQLQSGARRRFASERLADAEQNLRQAEAAHLRFLQSNRRYTDSPVLSFEENRLARQVQLRQEVFVTLTREVEEARIAEVRDTPLLTIIDPAVRPDRRSFPHRKLIVLLVMIASLFSALAIVLIGEWTAAERNSGSYDGFVRAVRRVGSEWKATIQRRRR